MDTVDIVGLLVPVTYFVLLATEKIWPARTFPPRNGWQFIGIAFLRCTVRDRHRAGVDPLAAALVGYVAAFYGFFQHGTCHAAMAGVSHPAAGIALRPSPAAAVHYYNFADLPVWDILFGTFRNPKEFRGECGFETPQDGRIGAMLGFADVNASLYGAGNVGVKPVLQVPG